MYTINDYKKIEQLMNENTCVSKICEIMGRNVQSVRKVIEDIVNKKYLNLLALPNLNILELKKVTQIPTNI